MRIFRSERRGNAVTKAKGSLWLRKLKVDAFAAQEKGSPSFNVAVRSKF